jgi:hypothetical protein
MGLVSNISCREYCALTCPRDPSFGLACVVVLVQVRDQDVSAFSGESYCYGASDARVRACDQDGATRESSMTSIRFFAVVRLWLERVCLPGSRLLLVRKWRTWAG